MAASDQSRKLFTMIVVAGSALAGPLAASCSSSAPAPGVDSGKTGSDANELQESSAQDTGTGAEFW